MAIEPIDLSDARRSILPRVKQRAHDGFGRRSFKAAQMSRQTRDWPIMPQQINAILISQLRQLRARSRYLRMNDPYASSFAGMKTRNIVGHMGVTMQAKVKQQRGDKLNEKLNKELEQGWTTWCLPKYCSVKKDMGFAAIQQFLQAQTTTDGEFFVQRVVDKANPFGMSLRIVDPDQLDAGYNSQIPLPNGNIIVMGVELDPELAPVAYHFFKPNLFYGASQPRERIRVPASDVIHYFVPWFVNQIRGIPEMAPSAYRLNMVSGYEDAEAQAARLGATKAGFFYNEKGETEYTGEKDKLDQNSFIDEVEPGQFDILPTGWKMQTYDPQHPNAAYAVFMKTALRAVSAGFGVDYPTLANDLESVTLSSMRGGMMETRDGYRIGQQNFIQHFICRVFSWWLEAVDLKGAVTLGKVTRDVVEESIVWTPRRWGYIDPMKDVQADILANDNGLGTLTNSLAEKGMDFEETIDQIAYQQQYIKAKGVKLGADLKGDSAGNGVVEEDDGETASSGQQDGGNKSGAKGGS